MARPSRDEEEEYNGDVWYEVWRSGGNPDAVSRDDLFDYYRDGYSAEAAAHAEMEQQNAAARARREEREHEEQLLEEAQRQAMGEEE